MRFSLILMAALVAVSQQQFRQYPNEGIFWLAPYYYSPQSTAVTNFYLPANYDNDDVDTHSFRQLQGNEPEMEDNYAGTKQRNKDINHHYQMPQSNARFVINLLTKTNFLSIAKTITFTLTSSVTFTKVESCIPNSHFSLGYSNVNCRRKRNEIAESSVINSTDIQSAIDPLNVQQVEPTVISSLHPPIGNVELPLISSSKDENFLNELQSLRPLPSVQQTRMKRLFFHFFTTTTVVSYSFFSTTKTKTVNLVSYMNIGQLICRPDGYSICSAISVTTNPTYNFIG